MIVLGIAASVALLVTTTVLVVGGRGGSRRVLRLRVGTPSGQQLHESRSPVGGSAFPAQDVKLRPAPNLPGLEHSVAAWRVSGRIDEKAAAKLAHGLGLEGAVTSARGDAWTVAAGDRLLTVFSDATRPWRLTVGSSDGTVSSPPVQPGPPRTQPASVVPGAKGKAVAMLRKGGVQVAGDDIVAVNGAASQFSTVTVTRVLAGSPTTGFGTFLDLDAHGRAVGGSGWLASPVRGRSYDLVGTTQAIARWNTHRGAGIAISPVPPGSIEPPLADDGSSGGTGSGTAVPGSVVEPPNGGGSERGPPPLPSEPVPSQPPATVVAGGPPITGPPVTGLVQTGPGAYAPRATSVPAPGPPVTGPPFRGPQVTTVPVTTVSGTGVPPAPAPTKPASITITKASVVLAYLQDVSGDAWLVPAYRLSGSNGFTVVTLAVPDDAVHIAPAPVPLRSQRSKTAAPPVSRWMNRCGRPVTLQAARDQLTEPLRTAAEGPCRRISDGRFCAPTHGYEFRVRRIR